MTPRARERPSRSAVLVAMALLVGTFAIYAPALGYDFLNFDDELYIAKNFVIRAGLTLEGLVWAAGFRFSNWYPLAWLSHMIDCQIYGIRPRGHHLTSILLHSVNAALLFWLLRRMTGRLAAAAVAAALFSLHPLRVESVAWVSERKDVLSLAFFLLTLFAYRAYASAPCTARYLSVMALLALGLMAKPILVSTPFLLLLLDYWPLGRLQIDDLRAGVRRSTALRRLLLEKVPLIVLCAVDGWLTVLAQRSYESIVSLAALPLELRVTNAIVSCGRYLGRLIWPSELAIFHPLPIDGWPTWLVLLNLLLLGTITLLAFRLGRSHPYFIVGWAWFLVALAPVSGVIQAGNQAMADRYTYLSMIGPAVAVSFGVDDVVRRWPRLRAPVVAGGAALLLALGTATVHQLGYWRNSETVMRRALAVADRLEQRWGIRTYRTVPHLNLGDALLDRGDYAEAEHHLGLALRFQPSNYRALNLMACALYSQGRVKEALWYFDRALEANPDFADAHSNKGMALEQLGELEDALVHFARARSLEPRNPGYVANYGFVLHRLGRSQEAIRALAEALELEPGNPLHWYRLGLVYEKLGEIQTAVRMYETSLQRGAPSDPGWVAKRTRRRLRALRRAGAPEGRGGP